MSEPKVVWEQFDLDDVMRYFAKGFKAPPGKQITRYEYFIDTHLRIVTFKLFVKKGTNE